MTAQTVVVDPTAMTWMCINGYHGSSERRTVSEVGFSGMFTGSCAGTMFWSGTRTETLCPCGCHADGSQ